MEDDVKRILFITGTRADFGKIKPLIEVTKDDDKFEYHIFCTGMHMLKKYGETINEIRKSGFKNIYPYINQNDSDSMEIILSNTIYGLSNFLQENNFDLIVIHGDRVETLAASIVGSIRNILVAHVEGGEISGTIDDLLRHSTSKMSHIHFVANEKAKKRLIQLGEIEQSIFIIGSPNIDILLSNNLPTLEEVKKYYSIDFEEYGIAVLHPVTTEYDLFEEYSNIFIDSLLESKKNYIIINPNNDIGSNFIMNSLKKIDNNEKFRIFPSMRFEYYLTLLKNSKCLIGNSSSGIYEAPVYGIPTINIGTRQQDRFNYESIHNISFDKNEIRNKILDTWNKKYKPSEYYGVGESSKKFIKILKGKDIWNISKQKKFQDLNV
jgi:UDP-N-acetylglucosamine 2-epimerase (hydrolysing)